MPEKVLFPGDLHAGLALLDGVWGESVRVHLVLEVVVLVYRVLQLLQHLIFHFF